MTSKWIQSAPAASTSLTSSPRRAKSVDRIDAAMRYMVGASLTGVFAAVAFAFRRIGGVAVHRVAHAAAGRFLTHQPEAWFVGRRVHGVAHAAALRFLTHKPEAWFVCRPVDDKAHHDALDPARGVERHEPDVVLGECLAAVVQLQHYAGGV